MKSHGDSSNGIVIYFPWQLTKVQKNVIVTEDWREKGWID